LAEDDHPNRIERQGKCSEDLSSRRENSVLRIRFSSQKLFDCL
jgi:hypothetical protein